ncbi:MAG: hypothetical protein AABX77_01610 [Nanoarchaeota archaeon]
MYKKTKKRIIDNIGFLVILLVILIAVFYFITSLITKHTGLIITDFDKNFKECLKERTIFLYINSKNPLETFGDFEIKEYLHNINIFNCSRNKDFCISKNIDYFPTWFIEGKKIEGDISIDVLEELSGC